MKVKTLEATPVQLEYALRSMESEDKDPYLEGFFKVNKDSRLHCSPLLAFRVHRQYEVSISYRDEYVCLSMWRSDIAMMYDQYAKKDKLDEAIVRIVLLAHVGNELEIPEELL